MSLTNRVCATNGMHYVNRVRWGIGLFYWLTASFRFPVTTLALDYDDGEGLASARINGGLLGEESFDSTNHPMSLDKGFDGNDCISMRESSMRENWEGFDLLVDGIGIKGGINWSEPHYQNGWFIFDKRTEDSSNCIGLKCIRI
jgi:hypothetical protein